MASDSDASSDADPGNAANTDSASRARSSSDDSASAGQERGEEGDRPAPQEIRLAKVSVTRTGHGITLDVLAGKLRVRLYIDAQWSKLIQNIAAGESERNQFVPFRMAPVEVGEDVDQLTPETLQARPIPELSRENVLYGTPLWDAIFPSDEPPERRLGADHQGETSGAPRKDESAGSGSPSDSSPQ